MNPNRTCSRVMHGAKRFGLSFCCLPVSYNSRVTSKAFIWYKSNRTYWTAEEFVHNSSFITAAKSTMVTFVILKKICVMS